MPEPSGGGDRRWPSLAAAAAGGGGDASHDLAAARRLRSVPASWVRCAVGWGGQAALRGPQARRELALGPALSPGSRGQGALSSEEGQCCERSAASWPWGGSCSAAAAAVAWRHERRPPSTPSAASGSRLSLQGVMLQRRAVQRSGSCGPTGVARANGGVSGASGGGMNRIKCGEGGSAELSGKRGGRQSLVYRGRGEGNTHTGGAGAGEQGPSARQAALHGAAVHCRQGGDHRGGGPHVAIREDAGPRVALPKLCCWEGGAQREEGMLVRGA